MTQQERTIATDREETEPCEAGTPGCCIDHTAERGTPQDDNGCECW